MVKTARRIVLADVAFGISAGIVLVLGLLRAVYFEEGPSYYFHSAFCGKAVALLNGRVAVDLSNNGVLVLERP